MKYLLCVIGAVLVLMRGALAAEPLNLSAGVPDPVGLHISYLQEAGEPLSLAQARAAHDAGRFQPSRHASLSFGIGVQPVWLAFDAHNGASHDLPRHLLIECSWLDQIDAFFLRQGEVVGQRRVGDTLLFATRPIESRYFTVPFDFKPGTTQIVMRVQSPDPMDLPIYLVTPEQADDRAMFEDYSYGFIYGAVAVLLAYNLLLFFGIRHARYFFYALYLGCFVSMNLAYTGHGYWLFWPQSPVWQMWSNPVLMIAHGVSGFLFAISFLDTKRHTPRVHRLVVVTALAFIAMEAFAVAVGSHVGALLVAFVFIPFFSVLMVWMGVAALINGLTYAKYFLLAALASVSGASITAVTVWGFVPYTVFGYRILEAGMVVDAVLLALALADQYRFGQEQKVRAERLARVDPLTGLKNRRGFYEQAEPAWRTCLRHKRSMSMIALDLDHFKAFNDANGHASGDDVLARVAGEFQRTARAGDIAARWGGEEFILFLPETTLEEAGAVAARLRQSIKAMRFDVRGQAASVTASFGVAECRNGDMILDELIALADRRLYVAKDRGRDQVVCTG